MFNVQFTEEAIAMTDTRAQFVSGRPIFRAALLLPAAALIFLGSVFQLGMLGYGQLDPRNLWPALMVVRAAWNFSAAQLNVPWLGDVSQFWPLLLVGAGLLSLFALRPDNRLEDRLEECCVSRSGAKRD
jgi:hypothetical protein